MRKRQHRQPLYRQPWLWIIVIGLLIGGSWWIMDQSTTTDTQDDTVAKTSDKPTKKKKKSTNNSPTSNHHQMTKGTASSHYNTQPPQNNEVPKTNSENSTRTFTNNDFYNSGQESWVDPDNYEPNSIVGDRSTMHCYLPGQSPYPPIAPENIVYFDSLAEARAAGYSPVQ